MQSKHPNILIMNPIYNHTLPKYQRSPQTTCNHSTYINLNAPTYTLPKTPLYLVNKPRFFKPSPFLQTLS